MSTKLQSDTHKNNNVTKTGTTTAVTTTCKQGRRNGTVTTAVSTTCKKEGGMGQ